MFSMMVMAAKTRVSWKVRTRPRRATLWGASPAMARPSKRIAPRSGWTKPVTRSNSVVFPAPLGPISAVIEPRLTVKLAPATARSPP